MLTKDNIIKRVIKIFNISYLKCINKNETTHKIIG